MEDVRNGGLTEINPYKCLEGLNKSTNSQTREVGVLPNTLEALQLEKISSPPSAASFHSTDKEMIPARNATDTNTQLFVGNNNLLLPILKAYLQLISTYTLLEILDGFTLCTVG